MAGFAFTLLMGMYFLPAIIAFARGKQNALAIGALNLFLGWTVFGWMIAFIWSLTADRFPQYVSVSQHVILPPYGPHPGVSYEPPPGYGYGYGYDYIPENRPQYPVPPRQQRSHRRPPPGPPMTIPQWEREPNDRYE